MRILLAFDKYKGSLTAKEVSLAVEAGIKSGWQEVEFDHCPIADGGDGFVPVLIQAFGGENRRVCVQDAQGRPSEACYGLIQANGKKVAVMEMSEASGIAKVQDLPLNPHTANTYGTGELILDACQQGVDQILLGIGGSATNDGGIGMLQALGFEFFDAENQRLNTFPEQMDRVARFTSPEVSWPEIIVACDVNNPLLGAQGATRVYGPQKGVTDAPWFEERLEVLAQAVCKLSGHDARELPGAGAAGGMGFALSAFLKAKLQPGFEMVAEVLHLEQKVAQADLVLTGEGRMDAQSLNGKGPLGVAILARKYHKPVIAVAGGIQDQEQLEAYFDGLFQIKREDLSLEYCIAHAAQLLEESVANRLDWLKERIPN